MTTSPQPSIPIVDLTAYTSKAPTLRQLIAQDLANACSSVGFVYIAGHGMPAELIQAAFAWSKRFFDLPAQDKMMAPHPAGPSVHRGYSHPGLEKVSQETGPDDEVGSRAKKLREVEDFKASGAASFVLSGSFRLFFMTIESYEVGAEHNSEQPNVWLPEAILPGFRAFMTDFYWAFHQTARLVLHVLAEGIGLGDEETGELLRLHSGLNNQLRLLHYPPVAAADVRTGKVARMPAHSDWSSFTMLLQDDTGGLEVENVQQSGDFIPATPVPGTLVLNVGDLLQRWSNDALHSTLHRVTLPPLSSADRLDSDGDGDGANHWTRARYSIPYFVAPDPDAVIECLPSCMGEGRPPKYESVVQRDYGKLRAGLHYVGV